MAESESQYGGIQVTRRLGVGITVDVAPQRAKMALLLLADHGASVRLDRGDIVIADQVVYRVTGYDVADRTLMLELVADWRPGQKDDPTKRTP